jgi:hypothetical protein
MFSVSFAVSNQIVYPHNTLELLPRNVTHAVNALLFFSLHLVWLVGYFAKLMLQRTVSVCYFRSSLLNSCIYLCSMTKTFNITF